MFSRINLTLVLAFAVAGLLLASPVAANLITDGDFESVATTNPSVGYRATTDSYHDTWALNGDIPGWTSTGTWNSGFAMFTYGANSGNQGGLPGNKAADFSTGGKFALYIRPTYTDVLSQTFTVTPLYSYSISLYSGVQSGNTGCFDMTLTPDAGSLTNGNTTGSATVWSAFAVSGSGYKGTVGPSGAGAWTGNYASGNGAWVQFTANFTASATTTSVTLKFDNSPSGNGACLDLIDAEVTSTPEPGTLALLAAGLAGLLCYAWRKWR